MRISIFKNSAEMTCYCKMTWLGNIKYKVNFFQHHLNGNKINAYIVVSDETPETLSPENQAVYDLWLTSGKGQEVIDTFAEMKK